MPLAPPVENTSLSYRLEGSVLAHLEAAMETKPSGGFRHHNSKAPADDGEFIFVKAAIETSEPLNSGWWKTALTIGARRQFQEGVDATDSDSNDFSKLVSSLNDALDCMEYTNLSVAGSHAVATNAIQHDSAGPEMKEQGFISYERKLTVWAGLLQP